MKSNKVEEEWFGNTASQSYKAHNWNSFNSVVGLSNPSNTSRLCSFQTIRIRHKGTAHQTSPIPCPTNLPLQHATATLPTHQGIFEA